MDKSVPPIWPLLTVMRSEDRILHQYCTLLVAVSLVSRVPAIDSSDFGLLPVLPFIAVVTYFSDSCFVIM